MCFVRYLFFEWDFIGIVDYIVEVIDGDVVVVSCCLDEIDVFI